MKGCLQPDRLRLLHAIYKESHRISNYAFRKGLSNSMVWYHVVEIHVIIDCRDAMMLEERLSLCDSFNNGGESMLRGMLDCL